MPTFLKEVFGRCLYARPPGTTCRQAIRYTMGWSILLIEDVNKVQSLSACVKQLCSQYPPVMQQGNRCVLKSIYACGGPRLSETNKRSGLMAVISRL